MKKLAVLLLTLLTLSFLFSCGDTTEGGEPELKEFTVTLAYDSEIVTVTGENPRTVKEGESVSFDVTVKEGYVVKSVSHGTYDATTEKLTVDNVMRNINVIFEVEEADFDTNVTFRYVFEGEDEDTSTPKAAPHINMGTQITVRAKNREKAFLGWSFGKNGEIVSTEKKFTFIATPEIVTGPTLYVYANYRDTNVFYIDPNGGEIDSYSLNMTASQYYNASVVDGVAKILLQDKYFNFAECASTFWDDGTFYRKGYVLREYNTKADGTGEGYSLGSKFSTKNGKNDAKLYCIWERDTFGFDYQDVTIPLPSGVKAANAPDWITSGIMITAMIQES